MTNKQKAKIMICALESDYFEYGTRVLIKGENCFEVVSMFEEGFETTREDLAQKYDTLDKGTQRELKGLYRQEKREKGGKRG